MNVGDVIKHKRKELSLTQSQLAEILGVSVQAVSKWERGAGYPDVTVLVPLARALGVSIDNLLDYKDRYKELNQKWLYACCKYEGGAESINTLIEIDEEALREYPNDKTFLYRRVVDKYRAAIAETDTDKRYDMLLACVGNAHWTLSKHPDDDSVISYLARAYAAMGERDLAVEYAYKAKDPQSLLKFVLTGDELRRHRQQLVSKKLGELLYELQGGGLECLQAGEDIIRSLISDGNYVWYYDHLAMSYIRRARIYAQENSCEDAIVCLERAFALAREKAQRNERKFTVPLFDMLDEEREAMPLLEQLKDICKRERSFVGFREDERYITLISEN